MKGNLTIDIEVEIDFDADEYVRLHGRAWPKLVASEPVSVDGKLRVFARVVPADSPLGPGETESHFEFEGD